MTTHLIIGGTGKTGRRVIDRLTRHRASVRSLSRPAFDWSAPRTWSSVEVGAHTAYITYAPEVAFPGASEAVADVARRLLATGTRRVVLLSGRGEPEAQRAEKLLQEAVRDHQASWAVVRCAFFMQNFSEGVFAESLAAGEFAFPAEEVREPFVDVDDVADVVTALLLGHAPADQVYELTGPRLLTFGEATALIAAAAGRDIDYVPVTMTDFVSGLLDAGVPRRLRAQSRRAVHAYPRRSQRVGRGRHPSRPGQASARVRSLRRDSREVRGMAGHRCRTLMAGSRASDERVRERPPARLVATSPTLPG